MHDIRRRILSEAVRRNALSRPVSFSPSGQRKSISGRMLRWRICLVLLSLLLFLPPSYLPSIRMLDPMQWAYLAAFISNMSGRDASLANIRDGSQGDMTFPAPEPIDLRVFPLLIKKVAIDPGHGGRDGGAALPPNIIEKEVTLDIGRRLRHLLEAVGLQVVMTRTGDETVAVDQRAAFANAENADLFVSIHVNWYGSATVRGAETYYLGPSDDSYTLELAARENRHSGYTLAEFRRLLENVYLDVRRSESRRFAEAIQYQLNQAQRTLDPTLRDRGVKMAPFLVLVATQMPAVLAEVSYLSNQKEAHLLATSEYRQLIAQALFQGIRDYAQVLNYTARKGK